jgi:hypothetical protein
MQHRGWAEEYRPFGFAPQTPPMLTVRLPQSAETQARLESSGLEVIDFDKREGGYRVRLGADDLGKRGDMLRQLVEEAYRRHVG